MNSIESADLINKSEFNETKNYSNDELENQLDGWISEQSLEIDPSDISNDNNLIKVSFPNSPANEFLEDYKPPPPPSEINKLELFYEQLNNDEIESLILYRNEKEFITKIMGLIQNNKSLKYLFVNNCSAMIKSNKLSIDDLDIFEALCDNNSITHLCVDYNTFKEETIKSLSKLIQKNNTIQYLNLNHCFINDDNLKLICEALKDNNTITDINLGCNCISIINPIYEMLKVNKTITKINLSYNQIKDLEPFINILQINNTLISINLCSNEIDDINVICKLIQQNISIEKINLKNNKFKVIKPLYDIIENNNYTTNNILIKLNDNPIEDIEYIDKLFEKKFHY